MLNLCRVTKVKVLFLVLVYVFNFNFGRHFGEGSISCIVLKTAQIFDNVLYLFSDTKFLLGHWKEISNK